ncbi:hypothetical protein Bca52824_017463 [Brassica carinata]|uniref:Zinc finger GRF-type domain-containing protein n=1 Tax=Brassica carinata TaxID=52824 RepID=A0A8X7VMZ8_BRACI|nr:hypothetical protein Bca52824_017463 [Brassica carinata]
MDPAEERRDRKRQKEYINMLGYMADSEYGILTRCPCGGRIINEVRGKEDYNTLPGKRFFTCKNYQADGFHYRQPWKPLRLIESSELALPSSSNALMNIRLHRHAVHGLRGATPSSCLHDLAPFADQVTTGSVQFSLDECPTEEPKQEAVETAGNLLNHLQHTVLSFP